MGIELEPGDAERLRAYLEALRSANARFNLTAIVEPETMWVRHIQDCLTLVPFLASAEAKTVIDVGSGGGLPGIPLAIVMPEVQFTLLEATGKKAAFIKETIAALGISNARILNDRAETAGQDHHDHRAKYDAVVARAVGKLNVLVELTVPFAREAGSIFLIKGDKAAEEVEEANDISDKYQKMLQASGGTLNPQQKLEILTDMSDWLGDIVVYCSSEAKRWGLPLDQILNVIMQSNFSKLDANGEPIYDERGKVMKGPNYWKPEPKISQLLSEDK